MTRYILGTRNTGVFLKKERDKVLELVSRQCGNYMTEINKECFAKPKCQCTGKASWRHDKVCGPLGKLQAVSKR